MDRRLQAGLVLVVATLAAASGIYYYRARVGYGALDGAGKALMSVSLPDLAGKPQTLLPLRGHVLLVNFWATWCAPCRQEIPALMKAQQKYASKSTKIVGIGIDNASKIREYAVEMRIDYPLLVGGLDAMKLSKALGNVAEVLPYTVVLDRSGKVAYAHAGALTETSLDAILAPLL